MLTARRKASNRKQWKLQHIYLGLAIPLNYASLEPGTIDQVSAVNTKCRLLLILSGSTYTLIDTESVPILKTRNMI